MIDNGVIITSLEKGIVPPVPFTSGLVRTYKRIESIIKILNNQPRKEIFDYIAYCVFICGTMCVKHTPLCMHLDQYKVFHTIQANCKIFDKILEWRLLNTDCDINHENFMAASLFVNKPFQLKRMNSLMFELVYLKRPKVLALLIKANAKLWYLQYNKSNRESFIIDNDAKWIHQLLYIVSSGSSGPYVTSIVHMYAQQNPALLQTLSEKVLKEQATKVDFTGKTALHHVIEYTNMLSSMTINMKINMKINADETNHKLDCIDTMKLLVKYGSMFHCTTKDDLFQRFISYINAYNVRRVQCMTDLRKGRRALFKKLIQKLYELVIVIFETSLIRKDFETIQQKMCECIVKATETFMGICKYGPVDFVDTILLHSRQQVKSKVAKKKLMYKAIHENRLSIVKVLIHHGMGALQLQQSQINDNLFIAIMIGPEMFTPVFEDAVSNGMCLSAIKTLINSKTKESPYFSILRRFMSHATKMVAEMTNILHKLGVDVNATNKKGHSPLSMACKLNDIEACRAFLHIGANANALYDAKLLRSLGNGTDCIFYNNKRNIIGDDGEDGYGKGCKGCKESNIILGSGVMLDSTTIKTTLLHHMWLKLKHHNDTTKEIVELLIRHGADPHDLLERYTRSKIVYNIQKSLLEICLTPCRDVLAMKIVFSQPRRTNRARRIKGIQQLPIYCITHLVGFIDRHQDSLLRKFKTSIRPRDKQIKTKCEVLMNRFFIRPSGTSDVGCCTDGTLMRQKSASFTCSSKVYGYQSIPL